MVSKKNQKINKTIIIKNHIKNYEDTADNLINKVKKNGYKVVRKGNNIFEFSNGKINFLVIICFIT